jgi:hypothetical protein
MASKRRFADDALAIGGSVSTVGASAAENCSGGSADAAERVDKVAGVPSMIARRGQRSLHVDGDRKMCV